MIRQTFEIFTFKISAMQEFDYFKELIFKHVVLIGVQGFRRLTLSTAHNFPPFEQIKYNVTAAQNFIFRPSVQIRRIKRLPYCTTKLQVSILSKKFHEQLKKIHTSHLFSELNLLI